MALHVPGLLTRIMPAIVSPRKTSSDSRRCGRPVCGVSASSDAPCMALSESTLVAIASHPAHPYIRYCQELEEQFGPGNAGALTFLLLKWRHIGPAPPHFRQPVRIGISRIEKPAYFSFQFVLYPPDLWLLVVDQQVSHGRIALVRGAHVA